MEALREDGAARPIAIVTPDIVGLVRNGGVGTACTELAHAFAGNGSPVTIFFTQPQVSQATLAGFAQQHAHYAAQGITLIVAEDWATNARFPPTAFNDQVRMSAIVHDWLKQESFGSVFFMDWQGNAYFALLAREAGIAHRQHGAFILVCHGSTLWSTLGNSAQRRRPADALTYFIERRSIELADIIVSPSQYMLDWMTEFNFHLPPASIKLPNLLSLQHQSARAYSTIDDIVFFGRLEYRKGLVQFCDAMDLLCAQGIQPRRTLFLGKFGHVGNEHAASYIARRSANWQHEVEIHARLSQPEAIALLCTLDCVAVVPSVQENSPYTVYECLAAGIPVLARDTGGIAEFFDPDSRQQYLFGAHPRELAERLIYALEHGLRPAPLPFTPAQLLRKWTALRAALPRHRAARQPLGTLDGPRVSICMPHYRRPALLATALESLRQQTYRNFEVILVDDGSDDPATTKFLDQQEAIFAERGWLLARIDNGYPGRARNYAAQLASGDYLLFMDDDNIALPTMLATMVTAALNVNADLTTCFAGIFEHAVTGTQQLTAVDYLLPVGGGLGYALQNNAISDTHALIRTSVFHALGGFTEDYGIGHEDFELYLKAMQRGYHVTVVPERLYWYRRQPGSITATTMLAVNRARSLRPLLEQTNPDLRELMVVAHGMAASFLLDEQATLERTGAPPALLPEHDPDGAEAIDAAATLLLQQGNYNLAAQLLAQIPVDAPQFDSASWRRQLLLAVLQEHPDALAPLLEEAHAVLRPDILPAQLELFIAIAEKQARSCLAILLHALVQARPDDPGCRLRLCKALADDAPQAMLAQFILALQAANTAYVTARPDISRAVERGDFVGGWDHYIKHGWDEQAGWHDPVTFAAVAHQLLDAGAIDLLLPTEATDLLHILRFFARKHVTDAGI